MNWLQVGENIKRHRTFQSKKQDCFAKEIGKTRQMLSRYENGRSEIPLPTLQLIAQKLDIPIAILLEIN
jgi:transcriptional regulator with XRE-family HTH domain